LVLEELIHETYEKGDRIIKINTLKINTPKKAKIVKPTKGQKVTNEEFYEIMKETNRKRDELYEQSQGNGIDKK